MHAGFDVEDHVGFQVYLIGASTNFPDSHEEISVEVNCGDGGDFEHAVQNSDHSIEASHVYNTFGVYTVTVRVSTHDGSTVTDTAMFFITTGS